MDNLTQQGVQMPLLRFSALLKDSWQLIKERFWVVLAIWLIASSVGGTIFVFNIMFTFSVSVGLAFMGQIGAAFSHVLDLVSMFIMTFSEVVGVILLVQAFMSPQKVTLNDLFQYAIKHFVRFWWVYVLYTFITYGMTTYFVLPGIYFAIVLSPVFCLLTVEDIKGPTAIGRMIEIMRGYAGTWILYMIVLALLFLAPLLVSIGGFLATFFLTSSFGVGGAGETHLVLNILFSVVFGILGLASLMLAFSLPVFSLAFTAKFFQQIYPTRVGIDRSHSFETAKTILIISGIGLMLGLMINGALSFMAYRAEDSDFEKMFTGETGSVKKDFDSLKELFD